MTLTNQRIISVLKKHGYRWPPVEPVVGKELHGLIFISLGRDKLHDSGYPFIQVYGYDRYGNLYDLGEHDHLWFHGPKDVNIDSLGANIFRVWFNAPVRVKRKHIASTLMVDEDHEVR